jgi:hypothetical protein
MVFGSDAERASLTTQLAELSRQLDLVRFHLDSLPARATTIDQPASVRWRGLATSILPGLPRTEDWPRFAGELDEGVSAGIDVATELPRLAVRDSPTVATPASPAEHVTQAPPTGDLTAPPRRADTDLAAAAYQPAKPPSPGPRR